MSNEFNWEINVDNPLKSYYFYALKIKLFEGFTMNIVAHIFKNWSFLKKNYHCSKNDHLFKTSTVLILWSEISFKFTMAD